MATSRSRSPSRRTNSSRNRASDALSSQQLNNIIVAIADEDYTSLQKLLPSTLRYFSDPEYNSRLEDFFQDLGKEIRREGYGSPLRNMILESLGENEDTTKSLLKIAEYSGKDILPDLLQKLVSDKNEHYPEILRQVKKARDILDAYETAIVRSINDDDYHDIVGDLRQRLESLCH